jgi:hypothetical protein
MVLCLARGAPFNLPLTFILIPFSFEKALLLNNVKVVFKNLKKLCFFCFSTDSLQIELVIQKNGCVVHVYIKLTPSLKKSFRLYFLSCAKLFSIAALFFCLT